TFRVQESLKGSFEVGKTVDVWHSKALDDRSGGSYDRSQDFELVTMETGQSYALFLIPVEREGSPAWAQTGHPELAQVRGDELVFLATDRYVEAVRERGLSLSGSSESPFAITLSQLREMARSLIRRSPATHKAAGSPSYS